MGACRLMVMIIIFFVACFTGTTHIYYPILLPMKAMVWVVTNMTEPVVNLSGAPGCWRVCELELFSDVLCQNRLDPYMWVSSNGLPVGDDAGLLTFCPRPQLCWGKRVSQQLAACQLLGTHESELNVQTAWKMSCFCQRSTHGHGRQPSSKVRRAIQKHRCPWFQRRTQEVVDFYMSMGCSWFVQHQLDHIYHPLPVSLRIVWRKQCAKDAVEDSSNNRPRRGAKYPRRNFKIAKTIHLQSRATKARDRQPRGL